MYFNCCIKIYFIAITNKIKFSIKKCHKTTAENPTIENCEKMCSNCCLKISFKAVANKLKSSIKKCHKTIAETKTAINL